MPRACLKFLLLIAVLLPISSAAFELPRELKGEVRKLFSQMTPPLPASEFGKLPDGLEIVEGKGYRGLKLKQGKLELRVHTWLDDVGLLENYNRTDSEMKANGEVEVLTAAINGAFYSPRGVLGQLISETRLPPGVLQVPGILSRSFLATFRGAKKRQFWYLGETSMKAHELFDPYNRSKAWFNTSTVFDSVIDNLIGGGGWILRDRQDVHMEAYERQRFRFRKEDQTSRKTVIAQDSDRNMYFLVFETGHNFHMVARTFVKDPAFAKVRDAIFLDGGSSSTIVLNGKYLVAPLYVVDKARFSCIQVLVPPTTW